jgi:hypothetical protein
MLLWEEFNLVKMQDMGLLTRRFSFCFDGPARSCLESMDGCALANVTLWKREGWDRPRETRKNHANKQIEMIPFGA